MCRNYKYVYTIIVYVYLVSDVLQIGEIVSRCFTELHLEDSTDSTNN